METLQKWMETRYLTWQQEHGRISIRKWSKELGISYSLLNNLMSGNNVGTTMQTAYQIGERLNDFSILELLGYPVPDAPLVGFTDEERAIILDLLENVKAQLEDVPEPEREAKLRQIVEAAGFTVTDSD